MQTDGLSFFVNDKDPSQELSDAFVGSMTYQPTVPSDQVTVLVKLNILLIFLRFFNLI